jgi:hypothetical protein
MTDRDEGRYSLLQGFSEEASLLPRARAAADNAGIPVDVWIYRTIRSKVIEDEKKHVELARRDTERGEIALTFYYGLDNKKRHTLSQVSDELARAGHTGNHGNPLQSDRVRRILRIALDEIGVHDCRDSFHLGATAKAERRLMEGVDGHVVQVGRGSRIEHKDLRPALEEWLKTRKHSIESDGMS